MALAPYQARGDGRLCPIVGGTRLAVASTMEPIFSSATGPASTASRRPSRKSGAPPSGRGPQRPSLEGVPVLVIEDDPASSKLVTIILSDAGAQVTAAPSAEEALLALETWTPRLIVVDLVLPRMGGLRLVEELRADPKYSDVTLVALTSLDGPHAERAALDAGCDAYLKKPIDADEFIGAITRILRGKQ